MYCTKCGKNIPDGSVFCPECGASVAASDAPQAPVYPQNPVYTQNPAYPQEPVYNQAPVYPQEPVYNQAPAYPQEPVYTQNPAYPQNPPYGQAPVYPAANRLDLAGSWKDPAKKPFFYFAGLAVLNFIFLFISFWKMSFSGFGYTESESFNAFELVKGIDGYGAGFAGFMVILLIILIVGLIVVSFLALKGGVFKEKTLNTVLMSGAIAFVVSNLLILISLASNNESEFGMSFKVGFGFGGIMSLIISLGIAFIYYYFFFKKKTAVPPVQPGMPTYM